MGNPQSSQSLARRSSGRATEHVVELMEKIRESAIVL